MLLLVLLLGCTILDAFSYKDGVDIGRVDCKVGARAVEAGVGRLAARVDFFGRSPALTVPPRSGQYRFPRAPQSSSSCRSQGTPYQASCAARFGTCFARGVKVVKLVRVLNLL